MPEENAKKVIVPPYNNEDIVEIIKDAIITGVITSDSQAVANDKIYTLKLVNGKVVLVEDE